MSRFKLEVSYRKQEPYVATLKITMDDMDIDKSMNELHDLFDVEMLMANVYVHGRYAVVELETKKKDVVDAMTKAVATCYFKLNAQQN